MAVVVVGRFDIRNGHAPRGWLWRGLGVLWRWFGEALEVWGGLGGTSRQWIYNMEFEKHSAWELLNKP